MLELVQRWATKLVPRIRNWRYEDRLAVLGLTTLHERRVRGDLIQMFKLTKGTNEVIWVNPRFTQVHSPNPDPPVASEVTLSGQASTKCLQRANIFTNKVVSEWNTLPATVIEADSVNQFKNRYGAFRTSHQTI
jgi:ribonuclease P/MRP protein subunit RPP40